MQTEFTEMKADIAQLRADVAQIRGDVAQIRADVTEMRTDLTYCKETRTEVRDLRADMVRMHQATDQAYGALKAQTSAEMEQKLCVHSDRLKQQAEERWDALEQRIAALEAAERRRR